MEGELGENFQENLCANFRKLVMTTALILFVLQATCIKKITLQAAVPNLQVGCTATITEVGPLRTQTKKSETHKFSRIRFFMSFCCLMALSTTQFPKIPVPMVIIYKMTRKTSRSMGNHVSLLVLSMASDELPITMPGDWNQTKILGC